jgi:hypothetical protein
LAEEDISTWGIRPGLVADHSVSILPMSRTVEISLDSHIYIHGLLLDY